MKLSDITLVLGVDAKHLEELRWAWPTWLKYKPELLQMALVVFYDREQVSPSQARFLEEHPQVRWVPWQMPRARSQREKMLCGFVQIPAREVGTPWYLKLDTDVIATSRDRWIEDDWFTSRQDGRPPVLIAPPWGYSKPRYVMDLYDDWGDGTPALSAFPRLALPYSSGSNKVIHPRIISWLMFGDTAWTRRVAALAEADGRLPYPSQDTFLFYCAARTSAPVLRVGMKNRGWAHLPLRKVKERASAMGLHPSQDLPQVEESSLTFMS